MSGPLLSFRRGSDLPSELQLEVLSYLLTASDPIKDMYQGGATR